jgi:hypothetical protein
MLSAGRVPARGELKLIPYDLSPVFSITESNGGRVLHGFSVVGINGRPLVAFNYATEEEAAAAREQMRQAIATAKSIVPYKA